jgi:pimeloyl-ACP methyl ester carboxylesterase
MDPTIERPVALETWLGVGPFPAATREEYIDHLVEWGGEEGIQPEEGRAHASPMAAGGVVRWVPLRAVEGQVKLDAQEIDWSSLQAHHGEAGVAHCSYAYAEFTVRGRRRALVAAERVSRFWLNGRAGFGDTYGAGYARLPVVLEDGVNRILVKFRGSGPFSFVLYPAGTPVVVNQQDITAPDLTVGTAFSGWLAVPLVNTTPVFLRGLVLRLHGDNIPTREIRLPDLAPLGIQKVPVWFCTEGDPSRIQGDSTEVVLELHGAGAAHQVRLPLFVRRPAEAFRATFRSLVDSSVQQFSVLPPRDFDPQRRYSLVLSLHGASGTSDGQVTAYAPKDWAFVVAPTNRRPYGFDWQDWGRLDALEVLDEVLRRFPIDADRVYLTGHSMGGHGVWHIGLLYPDRFAALAPSAGWTSFQLYAPSFLTRGYLYAPPALNAVRERALREDVPPLLVENAKNLPAFILQGEKDDDVWPFHARLMAGLVRGLGYQVVYAEMPGKGHWWDDDEHTPGVGCLDFPAMMDFLKARVREQDPAHVVFRTANASLSNRAYWVEIQRQETPLQDSRIEADVVGAHEIQVRTTNVREFALELRPGLVEPGRTRVQVDGRSLTATVDGRVVFKRRRDGFVLGEEKRDKGSKYPGHSGPIKQAFFSPFLFVYGTAGDEEDTAVNLRLAVASANYWWWRANGWVRVLPDTAVSQAEKASYNLVLWGGAQTNHLSAAVVSQGMPVAVRSGQVYIGSRVVQGENLALRVVYPSPFNPDRLVQLNAGTSIQGMELTNLLGPFYSAAGLPDYLVYSEAVKTKGWGGLTAAGFFDEHWRLDRESGWWQ